MKVRIYLSIIIFSISLGLQGQFPAELIESNTEISLKKNKLKKKVSKLLQINHTDADDYTNTGIYFSKGDDVKVNVVRIEDIKGNVLRVLKKKEIQTQSSVIRGALYSDDFVKFFQPKWHQYPYRIYYEYTHTVEDFLFIDRWSPIKQGDVFTHSARLSITLPKDYPINMSFPDSLEFSKTEIADEINYVWQANHLSPPKLEAHGPPLRSILPFVWVVPEKFKYGLIGSQKTWNDYGQWQYRMNEGLRTLPNSEKRKIDQLVAGLEDPKEIVSTLYRYLQENHRYILVAIEIGGLKPYPASYVCEKRYGDCKALTNFMQAMLEYVNIPSFYVKVYAGDNPLALKTEISGQQFNHVILGVPIDGDTIWLENTSNSNPPGYLGTFTQNRKGLLVDANYSRLIDLPPLQADEPTQHSIFNFKTGETGSGSLMITTTATNQDFESLNYYRKNTTPLKIKKRINRYFPLKNTSLTDYKFHQPDSLEPKIQLTTNWNTKQQFQKIGNRKVYTPIPFSSFELEKSTKRTQPVIFNYPTSELFEVNYELGNVKNYNIEIPPPIEINTAFGSLSVSALLDDGILKIRQHRIVNAGKFSLKEYPNLYDFITNSEKVSKKFLIVCTPK